MWGCFIDRGVKGDSVTGQNQKLGADLPLLPAGEGVADCRDLPGNSSQG